MCPQTEKMEVSLLLSTLVSLAFFLGADADYQENQTVSLCVRPNKAQFFEYESFSVACAGLHSQDRWRVETDNTAPLGLQASQTSDGSLMASPTYEYHTGDYWCQNARGDRSTATHIIVTGGSVLLEVPALPVVGQELRLVCRSKKEKKASSVHFKKNGKPLRDPVLRSPSSAHDALYQCHISGLGPSPASQLTFRNLSLCLTDELTTLTVAPPVVDSSSAQTLVPVVLSSLGVFLLLLLAVGAALRRWRKHKGGLQADVSTSVTYSTVTVKKERRRAPGPREGTPADPNWATYASVHV